MLLVLPRMQDMGVEVEFRTGADGTEWKFQFIIIHYVSLSLLFHMLLPLLPLFPGQKAREVD